MPLRNYAAFIRRQALLIIGITVLVGAVAAASVARQDKYYQADGSVLLKITDPRPITDYDYDQYYALQATEVYATNILSWLNSGEVNDGIRRDAQATDGSIRGRKTGGTIELIGTSVNQPESEALVRSAAKLITERTQTLAQGSTRSTFTTIPTAVTSKQVEPDPARAGGIGLIAGLIFGLAAALVREGTRPARRR